jgi:hypothetical protein
VVSFAAYIEVDLFSGRPNPSFELRGEEASHLRALLKQRREAVHQTPLQLGLGFRGFLIRFDQSSAPQYRVIDDIVVKGNEAFRDPTHETQNYIVSVLPASMRASVEPLLTR